jgi:hypothetical protein
MTFSVIHTGKTRGMGRFSGPGLDRATALEDARQAKQLGHDVTIDRDTDSARYTVLMHCDLGARRYYSGAETPEAAVRDARSRDDIEHGSEGACRIRVFEGLAEGLIGGRKPVLELTD